jgi:hypothetical protein
MAGCDEAGCDEPSAVRLHIPWSDDREVCLGHARSMVQRDGVVAEPLADTDIDWP